MPITTNNKPEIQHGNISFFLALPRELRDHIYLFLINDYRNPPDSPSHARDRSANSSSTYFEVQSPKPALLQLKLCSKQLYAEASDIISKHTSPDPGQAHLDIMVAGPTLYPTWLHLPLTRTLQPTIQVSLRLFSPAGWGTEFNNSAYRGLWSLFCSLVFQGPCWYDSPHGSRTRGLATPLQVGCLRFDIRLCFLTNVDYLFGTYRDVFDRLERLAMDNVGLGHVEMVEACFGSDRRAWRLKQFPTGLTFASRV
jgi:hypothetical protein